MWINSKKIDFEKLVDENGLIVNHINIPVMTGLGDSSIWRCTFENGSVFDVEFMPDEYGLICSKVKC